MDGEMGVVTAMEVERLMKKLSRERARIIKEFVSKAYALAVNEEFFQCHLSAMPDANELRRLLNDGSSTMRFKLWPTVNGIMVRREA